MTAPSRIREALAEMRVQQPVTVELPMPPSVNRIWRARNTGGKPSFYLDTRYATWKRVCDNIIMATRPRPKILGYFEATIILNADKRRGDADNRGKAILDFLQRAGIVENDKLANRVTIAWGYAPTGCRVEVWPSNAPVEKWRGAERAA